MIYTGEIKNGMVVLKDAPALENSTQVCVEILEPRTKLPRGSAEAIVRHAGGWSESSDEMDKSIEEIRQMKWKQVRHQHANINNSNAITADLNLTNISVFED